MQLGQARRAETARSSPSCWRPSSRTTTRSPRSRSPVRASSTSGSRPTPRARSRRRSSTPARRTARSDSLHGPDDQPGVHLRQPDRPAAPRPHPLGRRRRRAGPGAGRGRRQRHPRVLHQRPRRPDGEVRRRRCWRPRTGSRSPRTATTASTSSTSPSRSSPRTPAITRRCPRREQGVAFREAGYERQLKEQQSQLSSSGPTSTSGSPSAACTSRAVSSHAIEKLREQGHLYDADGALWMRTTDFTDDKDRVLIRSNGEPTYFASDAAYYVNKRERGFDRRASTCSAPTTTATSNRLKAIAACAGDDPDAQHRGPDRPAGEDPQGRRGDAAVQAGRHHRHARRAGRGGAASTPLRYTLCRYPADSPLTLDIEEMTRQASENPVYYVQYAHARLASILRNADDLGIDAATSSTRLCSATSGRATCSARWPSSRAWSPPRPSCASRTGSPATWRTTASAFHKFYDSCRVLPRGDEEVEPVHTGPPAAGRRDPDRARQRARPARRLRSGADVSARHEAGALHADIGHRGPAWLRAPRDVNDLVPPLWSANAKQDRPTASLEVGGVDVRDLVAEHGTPGVRAGRGGLPRPRPRVQRRVQGRSTSTTPARRSCCTAVVRWVIEEGLNLDVCRGGELAVALRAGVDPERIGFHGNNKSEAELARALDAGVGRIIVDSQFEIDRLIDAGRSSAASGRTGAGPGHRRRGGAHPRVHRDRARGPEVRLLDRRGRRLRSRCPGHRQRPELELLGLHSHIGSQIFDTSGFEVAARACSPARKGLRRARRRRCPSWTSAAASASPTPRRTTRRPGAAGRPGWRKIVEHECRAARARRAAGCRSSPAARSSARPMCTLYAVGTVKDGRARRRRDPARTSPSTAG